MYPSKYEQITCTNMSAYGRWSKLNDILISSQVCSNNLCLANSIGQNGMII
jgi:hypothetical protein